MSGQIDRIACPWLIRRFIDPEVSFLYVPTERVFDVAASTGAIAVLGTGQTFSQIGIFFSKMVVVTFGGAYAVLAYMAQQAVETYGWLKPGEMLDGLGTAETAPGPLTWWCSSSDF